MHLLTSQPAESDAASPESAQLGQEEGLWPPLAESPGRRAAEPAGCGLCDSPTKHLPAPPRLSWAHPGCKKGNFP